MSEQGPVSQPLRVGRKVSHIPFPTHNYGVIVKRGKFETRRVRAGRPQEFLWTTESLIPRCHVYTSGAHTIFVDLDKKDITVTKGGTN